MRLIIEEFSLEEHKYIFEQTTKIELGKSITDMGFSTENVLNLLDKCYDTFITAHINTDSEFDFKSNYKNDLNLKEIMKIISKCGEDLYKIIGEEMAITATNMLKDNFNHCSVLSCDTEKIVFSNEIIKNTKYIVTLEINSNLVIA